MGGVQQIHNRGTGRQLLFPQGNLAACDGTGKRDDQGRRLMRELMHGFDFEAPGIGLFGAIGRF